MMMMRKRWICLVLAALLYASAAARAQMMSLSPFKKPNIADIFKPVVGNGAVYETQRTDQEGAPKQPLEMTVVGSESFEGREAYWLEFAHRDARSGSLGYAKMLMTKDDFQPHRMIVQQPGQPAMELSLHVGMHASMHKHKEEELEKWHLAGSESIAVPAGTFSCQHWKKVEGVGDVWTTDKVSLFGQEKPHSPKSNCLHVDRLRSQAEWMQFQLPRLLPKDLFVFKWEGSTCRDAMPLPGDKHFQARILERRDLSPDLWLLRVDPGGPFKFLAGQYATLGVEQDGKRIERAYSIVSSPYEDALEFFLELVPHGELTPLLRNLKQGDTFFCRKIAKGRFTLDLRSGRTQHLLVSTVTGIAPFVSYIRTLYRDWKSGDSLMPGNHRFYCLQGGSRSWEFGYREELERFAAEVPWFKYVATVSRPWEDEDWKGETGRVDDLLRKYTASWSLRPESTTAYLCGHPNMVENARGILQRAGWKKGALFEELYFQPGKSGQSELANATIP